MIMYRDLVNAFTRLEIPRVTPVIIHSSLTSLGSVNGGARTVVGAILATWSQVLMPAFTYRTMLIPEQGPPNNGLRYGSGKEANRLNTPFHPDLPVDRSVGAVAETLRSLPGSLRSNHPLLSFTGMNVQPFLDAQNLQEPLGPLRLLYEQAGWVILLGVDHTANTSIHLAERLAGRKEFIRWAALPSKVVECYNIPGCADGFLKAASLLEPVTRSVPLGNTWLQALPLKEMIPLLVVRIKRDPFALLCDRPDCERCQAVRTIIRHRAGGH